MTSTRFAWIVAVSLAVVGGGAKADVPVKTPDLVLTWTEGEMSLDMSLTRVEIAVTGTAVHYGRRHSGRNSGMPGSRPVTVDGRVKDPRKLAAAIAALDALPIKKAPSSQDDDGGSYVESCLIRGKTTRCAGRTDVAELKALAAIRDALVDGLKLTP